MSAHSKDEGLEPCPLREALEEWARLSLVVESAVRNADWPNYQAIVRAINSTRAALSPKGEGE